MTRAYRVPFSECYEIDQKTGCWVWRQSLTAGTGYGQKNYRGRIQGAHRVSWLVHCGEIPRGMFVLHRCDERRCVNPAHLFLGTHADNMRDMHVKGRASTRFTADEVRSIREMRKEGKTLQAIGDMFGVRHTTIQWITSGKAWRHVQ